MNKRLDDYPDILKPEDLARLLGFSTNSVYRMLDNGELPGVRIGGQWRTLKTKLIDIFETKPAGSEPPYSPEHLQKMTAIGDYVRNKMEELLTKELIEDEEINRLRNKEYCRAEFGIHFPVLKDYSDSLPISEQIKVGNYNRYWKIVFAGKYLVCSQWHKGQRGKFENWVGRIAGKDTK